MRKVIYTLLVSLLLTGLLLGCAAPAEKTNPAEVYAGKNVRFICFAGAGGGFDTYSRLMAPYIAKYTGARSVVVENMPGGGGMIAHNYLYSAEPDGLTFMLGNPGGAVPAQLFEQEGINFDFAKYTTLGVVTYDISVISVGAKTPYVNMSPADTIAAMQAAPGLKYGGMGAGEEETSTFILMSEALGIKPKMVIGYEGSKAVLVAVMQGEVDVMSSSAASAARYSKDGDIVPKFAISRTRARELPDVPTIFELASLTKEGEWYIDYAANLSKTGRLMIAPPGMSYEVATFLRDAIEKTLHDGEFLAECKEAKRAIDYLPATESAKLIQELMGMSGSEVGQLKYLLFEKHF
ncbi:Bug family tripartite tricarboxylate transporter substrate binding protein [Chloroflexota bacterium]